MSQNNGANNGIFFLDPLIEIVETIFHTASIRGECPVSLILVGPSGSAKSKILKSYQSDHVHVTDSVTSQGLWDIAQYDAKNDKRMILIPDINPTLSRRPSTSNATVGNLLSLTTDGTVRVDDGRGQKTCKHIPMGLITACTPEIYHMHAKKWYALGLTRRIIPMFFTYSKKTQDALMKLVREDKIHGAFNEPKLIELPIHASPIIDSDIPLMFENLSKDLAINLGKTRFTDDSIKKWTIREIMPVSPHVTVRTVAKAHALRRKVGKVGSEEIDFVQDFISFTDPQNPRQL